MSWENRRKAPALSDVVTPDRLVALRARAEKYGVKDLRVFGSYACGEAGPESDLDLLVDIEYGRGVARRLLGLCEEANRVLSTVHLRPRAAGTEG